MSAPAPAPEVTRYFPRAGRTPPARLQLVRPNPFEEERTTYARPTTGATWEDILRMRGELPAEPSKPTRGPKCRHRAAVSPWNRPSFVYPEPEDQQGKRARELASCREGLEKIRATPKNLAALLKTPEWKGARVVGTVDVRGEEWLRVIHPSGTELTIRPQWGE